MQTKRDVEPVKSRFRSIVELVADVATWRQWVIDQPNADRVSGDK